MTFNISSTKLLKQLQILSGVLHNNPTLPILDNFLFELKKGAITITASDLETTMKTTVEANCNDEALVAIPAKLLLDTIKTFSNQPLTFNISDDFSIELASENGKYKLNGFNGEEFPATPTLEDTSSVSISSDVLSRAISKTLFATGNDDLRPVMNGVYFDFKEDGLTFVATDAHKLVRYTRTDVKASGNSSFITPKKPLNLLKNVLSSTESDVEVIYNDVNARFKFDHIELISRLIDGKYPNYEAVIPKENPNKLTIGKDSLLSSIKRVSIFASKTTHQVKLKMNGNELTVAAEDKEFANEAKETLSAAYEGEDMEIGFNSKFISEMLGNVESDEVLIEMSAPSRAGILLPAEKALAEEDMLMLVMPVMM